MTDHERIKQMDKEVMVEAATRRMELFWQEMERIKAGDSIDVADIKRATDVLWERGSLFYDRAIILAIINAAFEAGKEQVADSVSKQLVGTLWREGFDIDPETGSTNKRDK